MRKYALGVLFIFLLISSAAAGTCPFTGDVSPAEYSIVTVNPPQKYVGEKLTIRIIDVFDGGDSREPADNRIVLVYYILDGEVVSEYSLRTDSGGEAEFRPENSGQYSVATSSRQLFFEVESRCGDGLCTHGEDRENCVQDCATCGDGICDENEDKEVCPDDCVVCGDGSCDTGENRESCPEDCATCGDDICDVNENKIICPADCVVCGDGVCDPQEIIALHNTTCPEDCAVCGDGWCEVTENATVCPEDCAECGDSICSPSESYSDCPEDCIIHVNETNETDEGQEGAIVCGDNNCTDGENKENCPEDCVVCGDGVCDSIEVTGLHSTSCGEDCYVCGDGVCDAGEEQKCENDCGEDAQGLMTGYFLIPLIIVIIIVLFEVTNHFAGEKRQPSKRKSPPERIKMKHLETGDVIPYFLVFGVLIALSAIFLSMMDIGVQNLAVFDLGAFILKNGILIALTATFAAIGLGIVARAAYFMETGQTLTLSLVFTFLGMMPGLLIFHNIEYMMLMFGLMLGVAFATLRTKSEERELNVKKPFKIGSEFADKTLFMGAIFLAITVFLSLYAGEDTADHLSSAIWESQYTRGYAQENYPGVGGKEELKDNVISPFFSNDIGGLDGKLVFSIGIAILVLVLLKAFILIIRLMAGSFAWVLDKYMK
jgi:hypothetical protein